MSELDIYNGKVTDIVLALEQGTSYEQFERACAALGVMYAATRAVDSEIKFAIGDLIVKGEALYGARAYQAFEEFGMSEEVMSECARISGKVPPRNRRKGLTWSHHRAVAALPVETQREWLSRARTQSLSHHALREALRAQGASPPAARALRCRCCGREYE